MEDEPEPAPSLTPSYFDVSARRVFLTETNDQILTALTAPRKISLSTSVDQLGAPIEGAFSVPPFYLNVSTGERNPDWGPAMRPL